MLHLIYILAFTILAFLAVGNLVRNLMLLSTDNQRTYSPIGRFPVSSDPYYRQSRMFAVPHPELLDAAGNFVNEPFLVMRSIDVEDAREQLDALYRASPGSSDEVHE